MTKPRSDQPPFSPKPRHGSARYVTYGDPGRWELRVGVGRDIGTGRHEVERTIIGPLNERGRPLTKRDVETMCEAWALQVRASREERPASALTFGEVVDVHLERLVAKGLAAKTESEYRRYAREWIKPRLGHMKLKDLRGGHFDELYLAMRQPGADRRSLTQPKGLSGSAINSAHAVCSGACKTAMSKGWLSWNPAAASVERPPRRTKRISSPRLDHVRDILAECSTDATMADLATMAMTAMGAGLREAECCGLRWRNLDVDAQILTCDNNIVEKSRGRHLDDPDYIKTYGTHTWGDAPMKGRDLDDTAQIHIPTILAALLSRHREVVEERARWANTSIDEESYIFSFDPAGREPIRPARLGGRWRAAAARAGHKIRFHDLRHLYGTTLSAGGVDLAVAQEQMRHSTQATFLAFYNHVKDNDARRRAADVINEEFAAIFEATPPPAPQRHLKVVPNRRPRAS